MTNADKIRQMTDEELLEDRLPLTGRDPVLIELFARRYCPPPLCPEGKRNKEMEDDKR